MMHLPSEPNDKQPAVTKPVCSMQRLSSLVSLVVDGEWSQDIYQALQLALRDSAFWVLVQPGVDESFSFFLIEGQNCAAEFHLFSTEAEAIATCAIINTEIDLGICARQIAIPRLMTCAGEDLKECEIVLNFAGQSFCFESGDWLRIVLNTRPQEALCQLDVDDWEAPPAWSTHEEMRAQQAFEAQLKRILVSLSDAVEVYIGVIGVEWLCLGVFQGTRMAPLPAEVENRLLSLLASCCPWPVQQLRIASISAESAKILQQKGLTEISVANP